MAAEVPLLLNSMDRCKYGFHVVDVLWSQADVLIVMDQVGDIMTDYVLDVVEVESVQFAMAQEDIMKFNTDNIFVIFLGEEGDEETPLSFNLYLLIPIYCSFPNLNCSLNHWAMGVSLICRNKFRFSSLITCAVTLSASALRLYSLECSHPL